MTEQSFNDKVVTVQSELKAPKGQYNSFGKYKYRSLEDINEAVKPLLAKVGLTMTISDEPIMIGERIYIKATAVLSDGNESLSVSGYAREAAIKKGMDDSQITGAASSYARKYALNGLFLIDDTKDADTDENQQERTERSKKQGNKSSGLSEAQKKTATEKLTNFANAQSMTLQEATEKLFPYLKIQSSLPNLTPDEFGILMNYLNQHQ